MYYEESWINGKLMYRTTPNGTWYVCTTEQLYRRIHELEAALKQSRACA
jgi:hypothetical protein